MPEPIIPENIVVHLGAPNSDALNVTLPFADYIKNVASSEIYPSWPKEAIKANVMAQISVALNRVYTRFYRNNGRNFDITSSPAYDQTFVYQRDIFDTVSNVVDELFDSYIRRSGTVEPLFAQFCDGVEVQCQGLSQWGSVELANNGLSYEEILRNYYGTDIEIVQNVPVQNTVDPAPQIPLSEGDVGRNVELIQIRLNRISRNFPGIPKIYPQNGFFSESTKNAVIKFQEVFGLTPDGIVGKSTWNKINSIYNSVKQLSAITSEGLQITELQTQYPGELTRGATGEGVSTIQYYLSYISLFVPSVNSVSVDGDYGELTENAVKSFQSSFSLNETGVVNEITWNSLENTYYEILRTIPYKYEEGVILPYPGRLIRLGTEGDDVRALQSYLNYISQTYPDIPKVTVDGIYGISTENAVNKFRDIFGIEGARDRVGAQTWNAIISVYDDLYVGNIVQEEQFPGYGIG